MKIKCMSDCSGLKVIDIFDESECSDAYNIVVLSPRKLIYRCDCYFVSSVLCFSTKKDKQT